MFEKSSTLSEMAIRGHLSEVGGLRGVCWEMISRNLGEESEITLE